MARRESLLSRQATAKLFRVFFRMAIWTSALLLAAGLIASQLLFGGWWYPALALPGLALVALAAMFGAFSSFRAGGAGAPGAWCVGAVILFAGYLLWRQSNSPDYYTAREDMWLLLGALAVYFTAAWHLRGSGAVYAVLVVLFALLVFQVFLVVMQFTAESPFHPWPHLARWFLLPDGTTAMANHGFALGTFASRGTLSAVLQTSTFLALGILVWGRVPVWAKLILFWVTAAGLVGLVLCLSRAAYTGVLGGMMVFAVASFFIVQRGAIVHRGWLTVGALSLVVVCAGLALVVGLESFAVRMRLDTLGSDTFRENLWFAVVPPMLTLDPWWGSGANVFDLLASRYRNATLGASRPFHAHNDWLQLLVEYGRIGLLLGAGVFLVHFVAGWKNILRVSRESAADAMLPQSMELGLLSGSLAAMVGQGLHSVFDHRMHVAAPVLLFALCAGWVAGCRRDSANSYPEPGRWWFRVLGVVLPLAASVALLWQVRPHAAAEYEALQAENALVEGDLDTAWDHVTRGLSSGPRNPRLLVLAGETAGLSGNMAKTEEDRRRWYKISTDSWLKAVAERPQYAYALRETALVMNWSGRSAEAGPWHLRAIALDPNHAGGYEYLGVHFWVLGKNDEAQRLFRLAQRLPGARLAGEFLRQIEEERRTEN